MSTPSTTLGTRLKSARAAKNLSLRELEEKTGMHNSTLSKIESDTKGTSDDGYSKLSKALGVSIVWLKTGFGDGPKTKAPKPKVEPEEAKAALAHAVRPASPTGAASSADGEMILASYEDLAQSTYNPRKTFDEVELDELADSIKVNGVMQNLVVRLRDADLPLSLLNPYEIVAGARRYRAIEILIRKGEWDPKAKNIPCRVKRLSEGQARAISIIENLQRVNVHPLDEGEALVELHKLDPEAWSTAKMAEYLGKSLRYIQTRMQIAQKLDDKVKVAFRAGEIQLEHARHLVMAPGKRQREIVENIAQGGYGYDSPEEVQDEITENLRPVEWAIFPVELYKGEIVEAAIDRGEPLRYFADADQFQKLQSAAVETRLAELKEKWSWAKKGEWYYESQYDRSKDRKKAGAFVRVSRAGEVTIFEGLIDRSAAAAEARRQQQQHLVESEADPFDEYEDKVRETLRETKRSAQASMAARPDVYKRVYILMHLQDRDWGYVAEMVDTDDLRPVDAELKRVFGDLYDPEKSLDDMPIAETGPDLAWRTIAAADDAAIDRIFGFLLCRATSVTEHSGGLQAVSVAGREILKALSLDMPTLPPKPEGYDEANGLDEDDEDEEGARAEEDAEAEGADT